MSDEELLALLSEEERREWPTLSLADQAAMRDMLTQRVPAAIELRELTQRLFNLVRLRAARILRPQHFDDATPHECLDNAIAWVRRHPGHAMVSGFLYHDFGYRWPHVRFVPHVAVQTENGQWLDVTLQEAQDNHPFLQHPGTEQEFQAAFGHGPMDLIYR
jgi:hypothetical protein